MTSRHAISCKSCGALLGRLNRGDRSARRGIATRVVTTSPGVRVFLDLAIGRAEFHCPACGACGRTVSGETIRGVVVQVLDGTVLESAQSM